MASGPECAPRGVALSSRDAEEKDANDLAPERSEGFRFPKSVRITNRSQYLKIYREGRRVRSRRMTLFALPNGLEESRIGITVTRKVGGAVLRNRVKRRFREIFRKHRRELKPPLDIVVNAHVGIAKAQFAEIEKEFVEQFRALTRRRPS